MDFLQKIGGRKFIMALIAMGVATFIELNHANGLSATMAAFLGSLVAAFSVANFAVTAKHMKSRSNGSKGDSDLEDKVDQLLALNSPENISNLGNLLNGMNSSLVELKSTYGQMGQAVVNIGKEVQSLKQR